VIIHFDYSAEQLAFLAAHDSDPVNRWNAAQSTHASAILALAAAHRAGRPLQVPAALLDMMRMLLADHTGDPALLALALTLPDAGYVAALDDVIDVDGIAAAHRFLRRELALQLRDAFTHRFEARRVRAPYAPTPDQTGARKLASTCLAYLGAIDDDASSALAVAHFDAADNMTDSMGALDALRDTTSAAREQLFARFEDKWRDEPLVLDKWFSLEALAWRAGTLERIRHLLAHPRFNARNPNRVRALVGAFTLRNFEQFHAADGSGYAFAADQVLALDGTNPQIAAVVAGAFNLWKRFPEPRRGLMEAALQRIAAAPGLSPDVTEVVTRTLAD
jgi:aminopeptidase N